MPKRIALIVDHPLRDLPGLVLVALKLCRPGVVCYLVPHNLLFRNGGKEFWALAPDLVLLNYVRNNNEDFVRDLIEAQIPFGVLDTEGGVLSDMDRGYTSCLSSDSRLRRELSFYCGWGPKLTEHIKGWFENASISVTGVPRYDFYAPKWREAALKLSSYGDDYTRPLVLISGNFPLANPVFHTPEQELRMYIEDLGYDKDSIISTQQSDSKNMLAMVELANNLARAFPDATFIYRPHPFEKMETYDDLLEPYDNLRLVKLGSVDGWIMRASAIIQSACSTGVEAGLVGVPALWPAWFPANPSMPSVESVSILCQAEAELFQSLEAILNGTFQLPTSVKAGLDEVISDWFFLIDGLAHARVADCVLRGLPADGEKTRLRNCEEQFFFGRATSLKAKAHTGLVKALGLPGDWSFKKWRRFEDVSYLARWDQSAKFFGFEQVKQLVDVILAQKPESFNAVEVRQAQAGTDYYFDYDHGRSVALTSV